MVYQMPKISMSTIFGLIALQLLDCNSNSLSANAVYACTVQGPLFSPNRVKKGSMFVQ